MKATTGLVLCVRVVGFEMGAFCAEVHNTWQVSEYRHLYRKKIALGAKVDRRLALQIVVFVGLSKRLPCVAAR